VEAIVEGEKLVRKTTTSMRQPVARCPRQPVRFGLL